MSPSLWSVWRRVGTPRDRRANATRLAERYFWGRLRLSSQARMGAMRVTIDEPVERRPVMPVALMAGHDEPEQEHPTDSAQRAVGGVGPGAIGNMSANLSAGASATGTLLNATPPPLPSAPDEPEPEYPTDSTSQASSATATDIAFAGRVLAGALTPTMPAVPQQPRIFPGVPEPTLVIHWRPTRRSTRSTRRE
jgi:hypothetical protein